MKKLSVIISETKNPNRPKNLSTEFQIYGVYLCEALEANNYALFIKLAKMYDRGVLEEALTFCRDYPAAKNKTKLFMWKLTQLRKAMKESRSNPS